MIFERQDRFPKGTFKVQTQGQGAGAPLLALNLNTGRQACCQNLWELVKHIERDLAGSRYPQSSVRYRSWNTGGAQAKPDDANGIPLENAQEAPAPTAGPTFVIKVFYQQNATWQGTVQWIEGRQTRQYRSINELMWLMDDAMAAPPMQADEPTA